ncbi:MAG: hydroxymethylglutaryl-CoA lyase [Acidobacteria bacterium]|nr:hydroxymethylglutaryl-CoA lyase [Acidobacteriota bacterium]
MTGVARDVVVVEVGPRDGLQNESPAVSTAAKIEFIDRLSASGVPVIEAGAFVSQTWVPQMADSIEVLAGIARRPGTRYIALVPNERGLDRATDARVDGVSCIVAASETFSQRNTNTSIAGGLERAAAVASRAVAARLSVRTYLSTSFGCPYEGPVPTARVCTLVQRLLDEGAEEVAVSDTIGVAGPGDVRRLLDALVPSVPVGALALHFHDTWGMAAANVLAALEYGVRTFDASAGGLGGCPYAPGATGNLATEDLLYLLHGLGRSTGVDLDRVYEASRWIEPALTHVLPSRYVRARTATHQRRG